MKFTTTVDVSKLNTNSIVSKIADDRAKTFMTQSVYKNYYQFMPYRTGQFANTIDFGVGYYTHKAPHSTSAYDANRSFRKDIHPLATGDYIEKGKEVAMPKVVNDMNDYANSIYS